MGQRIIVVPGTQFGRLTIVKEIEPYRSPSGEPKRKFLCLCSCGEESRVTLAHLRDGHTKSCVCYQKDQARKTKFKHGFAKKGYRPSEYGIWVGIKQRTQNIEDASWPNYGGRGITVCARWRDSFENFLEDMGPRPGLNYSIERLENDGDYEPSNCVWATWETQNKNRRVSLAVVLNGEKYSLTEIAREFNVSYFSLYHHLYRNRLPLEAALKRAKKLGNNSRLASR